VGYTPIEYQPVVFDYDPDDCKVNGIDCPNLVSPGDITQIQFEIDPCEGYPSVINNGDFAGSGLWSLGAGWTILGGQACKAAGNVTFLTQNGVFVLGKHYKVNIRVDSVVGEVLVFAGNSGFARITSAGNYVYYVSSTNNETLSFAPQTVDTEICLSEVTAIEIEKNLIVSAWTKEGVFFKQWSGSVDPNLFTFADGTCTFSLDWSQEGLISGCYYLCIHDPCINTIGQNGIYNGSFEYEGAELDEGWQEQVISGVGSINIGGDQATFTSNVGLTQIDFLSLKTQVNNGTSYFVQYTISTISNATAVVELGGVQGTPRTTPGTYQEFIISGGNDIRLININGPVGTGTIVWDDVKISLRNGSDLVCNSQSNNFAVGEYDCTIYAQLNCANNGLGFKFENTGFTISYRWDGRFTNSDNPFGLFESEFLTATSGLKNNTYYNARKQKSLVFSNAPEYIVDFLSLWSAFSEVIINGVSYVIPLDSFPSLAWDEVTRTTSEVVLPIEKRQQKKTKIFKIQPPDPTIEIDVMVEPNTNDTLIEPNTGQTIKVYG